LADTAPLSPAQIDRVWRLASEAEDKLGGRRDVAWTYRKHELFALQCRPATGSVPEDERRWYLGLQCSYESLRELHHQIEEELIPQMNAVAACFDAVALDALSDTALAAELRRRALAVDHWRQVYRKAFIPFAHGVRLFAQVYNDAVRPENPYEFLALLAAADLWSVRRNEALLKMARMAKSAPGTLAALETRRMDRVAPEFQAAVAAVMAEFGCMFEWAGVGEAPEHQLAALLRETAGAALPRRTDGIPPERLEDAFLAHFPPAETPRARELLRLARASYRIRDDDNLHLGQIEAQLAKALRLARARLRKSLGDRADRLADEILPLALREPATSTSLFAPTREPAVQSVTGHDNATCAARQLVGQPAGPGMVSGTARVITRREQFFSFRRGEVLVCDAIDPNVAFVVPLAVAVVERRGGMLIHGAIIAREYGLPCVTGVPDATSAIPDGARVTVDGYLGIVTVESPPPTNTAPGS
jgi:pyruvate,water dikinase